MKEIFVDFRYFFLLTLEIRLRKNIREERWGGGRVRRGVSEFEVGSWKINVKYII